MPDARSGAPEGLRPSDVIGSFFIAGLAMSAVGIVAAVIHAVDPWSWGGWLALHLIFVGGISQLILGASQFFSGAFLATDPPPRSLIRAELAGWNSGALLLAVGVAAESSGVAYLGAICLVATLALYAAGLFEMRRRSLSSVPWATRWYLTGAAFLGVGTVAGVALATRTGWPHGDLLAGHMALNLAGWFGCAIVGTLHTFFPSLTGSRLRHPRLQPPTFAAWSLGVGALSVGYGFSLEPLAQAGWLLLAGAAAMLSANLVASLRAATRPLSLPARLVGAAQTFLLAGIVVACVAALGDGPSQAVAGSARGAVGTLLVAGWIGLTVIGSLLHLLALLIRVRDLKAGMPQPRPGRDTAIVALAVAGVGAVALADLAGSELEPGASVLLVSAYAVLLARVGQLAATVLTRARPRL